MRRRDFISGFAGSAAAWPLGTHAQPAGKTVRVGFLGPSLSNASPLAHYQAFITRLREHGLREGENLLVDHRVVDDPRGAFVAATELMRLNPDLIVALGPEVALQAVIGASRAIPIVMVAINFDPMERGYITSLARPTGNITGVVYRNPELAVKQVELLTRAFPQKKKLIILWDALTGDQFRSAMHAAESLQIDAHGLKLENPPYDPERVFRDVTAAGPEMLLVLSSPFFIPHMRSIAQLTIANRLPTMFIAKQWVQRGGLFSYGVDFFSMYRRAADFVARILKGESPADLPVEQPTKFEFVINLKTAQTIGVELPPIILLGADEVIE